MRAEHYWKHDDRNPDLDKAVDYLFNHTTALALIWMVRGKDENDYSIDAALKGDSYDKIPLIGILIQELANQHGKDSESIAIKHLRELNEELLGESWF